MAIDLVTKFASYTDEQFTAESRKSLLTNQDFDWTGAHTVKVFKISTAEMNDYGRNGPMTDVAMVDGQIVGDKAWSCYGPLATLSANTQEFTLKKDRSFIFPIDKLDEDETLQQLGASAALGRQIREVVIPEVDTYAYGVMCAQAGYKPEAIALTAENIYSHILNGSEALDNAEAPETNRVLLVNPTTYTLLKKCPEVVMETDIGSEMRQRGVIGMLDGCSVIKVPANRLPVDFGFMIAHPSATVAPTKLEDYKVHHDTIYNSGSIVTGRVCYDAFVLDNKKNGIYYQAVTE